MELNAKFEIYDEGYFEIEDKRFRFIVMQKYDYDLFKVKQTYQNSLKIEHVAQIGVNILNQLKILHGKGYAHGKVLPTNIMIEGPMNKVR